MNLTKLLAALAATGGLSALAQAQAPPAPPAAPQTPRVIQWPGGSLVMNGPEVILRSSTPGSATNLITGSGNGIGNRIVVDGGAGGVTVVQNARNGIGNRLVINPDDLLIDLDALLAPPKPAPAPAPVPAAAPSYKGKASTFWTKKEFSEALDCNLYWCPTTKLWFRYSAEDDTYRPAPTQPAAPVEMK